MNALSVRKPYSSYAISSIASLLFLAGLSCARAEPESRVDSEAAGNLWAHDNLYAWCVVPFDAKKRDPDERARMLARLGFKSFAYDWREKDIPTFDAEIEALQTHHINLLAWWFPFDADDPNAKATLEVFKRHNVHPQLWVVQSNSKERQGPEKFLPKGMALPKTQEEFDSLSETQKAAFTAAFRKAVSQFNEAGMTKTPQEQEQRVRKEADRINALVKLAGPYGSRIELYNHNGWFGMLANMLAIIGRLKELGVSDVGIVYNFSHARDDLHDDTRNFPSLWKKIKPYVAAVNITGTYSEGTLIYPGQGDRELEMMRTIQESGWRGPVGLIAEKGGDAEMTLRNYLVGLDWLSAELKHSGSGGRRPFLAVR
jgi:hypothetical protein